MDIMLTIEIASLCTEFIVDMIMTGIMFAGIVFTGIGIAKKKGYIHDIQE